VSQIKYTILESWPALRGDLASFLADTDGWAISELKKARKADDWAKVLGIIDVMELLHNISHSH